MRVAEITEFGDSSTVEVTDHEKSEPGDGELRVEVKAAGINFADIMQRRGHYQGGPEPPYVPGMEVAGVVDAVGDGVGRDVGDEVMGFVNHGGYAEYAIANASGVFDLPENMSYAEGAGFPVQFLTAHNCLFEWGDLEEGEQVLIHAAAGGVGTAAVQLASNAGAEVFGTASTEEKLSLAEELGCDHPIQYTEVDFVEQVNDITDGDGVDIVLDGIGGETTTESLKALTHMGRLVAFGAASGEPGTPNTADLLFNNHSVIGYHLGQAMLRTPGKVFGAVPKLNGALESGDLEVIVGHEFDLEDAAEAHQFIEDRKSSGKVVLKP
jgi:NADPH2:quinone reductase